MKPLLSLLLAALLSSHCHADDSADKIEALKEQVAEQKKELSERKSQIESLVDFIRTYEIQVSQLELCVTKLSSHSLTGQVNALLNIKIEARGYLDEKFPGLYKPYRPNPSASERKE